MPDPIVRGPLIRDATEDDLEAITAIYNWTIENNHVSFDIEPFDVASRVAWWRARSPELVCLVAENSGEVVGVSYSSWYRDKAAYRSTMETTIVLDERERGRGVGSALLGELCERLTQRGLHRAVAIIALPNDASVALHNKLGYRSVGVLSEIGRKLGQYWDTEIMEKPLAPEPER